jgi:5-deoxy-glucuronate isomerase
MGSTETVLASPGLGNSTYLSLLRLTFDSPGSRLLETKEQEHAVNILSGIGALRIFPADGGQLWIDPIGSRDDIFGGNPEMAYIPIHCRYEIMCRSFPFEALIYMAPTDESAPVVQVKAEQVKTVTSGASDWQRQVYIGMGADGPATRMILGETESPPGNWSGFPPHRHTISDLPREAMLEELYYFSFNPPTGFIIGAVYDDPDAKEDACLKLFRQGQVFDVSRGYHFLAPCPGYRVRYTWALGGPVKAFGAWLDDPELAWLHNSQP